MAFSRHIWSLRHILRVPRVLKAALPDVVTILGGPSVTPPDEAESVLKCSSDTDMIVRGPGELVFMEILRSLLGIKRVREIGSISYRAGRTIVHHSRAPYVASLDDLPSIILSGELRAQFKNSIVSLQLSQGCMLDCAYCDWGKSGFQNGRRTVCASVGRALDEVRYVFGHYPQVAKIHYLDAFLFGGNINKTASFLRRKAGFDENLRNGTYLCRAG